MDQRQRQTVVFPETELPVAAEADVIVAGGGPAGVSAALAAARNGASVFLIEQRGYLGGMATVAHVPTFCPFTDQRKPVVRGIGLEILEDMKARMDPAFRREWDGILDWVPIDAEILKRLLDKKMLEAGVRLLYHTFVAGAVVRDGFVEGLVIANKSGMQVVRGAIYIDATSDADIVHYAGGPTQKGGDGGELQPGTMCFVLTCLDRATFLRHKDEVGHDLRHAIRRAVERKELNVVRDWAGIAWLNDQTAGFNFGHVFGIDGSRAEDLTRGAIEGRALVHHIVEWLRRSIPGFANAMLVATGDQIGIRETRRIVGEYVVTVNDFLNCVSFPDDVSRNAYFIDIHMATPKDGMKMVHLPPGQSHGIPYRALIPLGLKNVLVAGRAISTDRVTQGSTRVMPNCFAMGQAAGTAAAILVKMGERRVRRVPIERLQWTLVRQGAWLGEELEERYARASGD